MSALPFRLFSEFQVLSFRKLLEQAISEWEKTWFVDEFRSVINFEDVRPSLVKGEWLIFEQDIDSWVAWKSGDEAMHHLVATIFNATAVTQKSKSLVEELFRECIRNFIQEIRKNLPEAAFDFQTEQIDTLESLRLGYGSGALLAEVQGAFSRQYVAFGGGLIESLIGTDKRHETRYDLVKREFAIESYKANLEVTIGSADVTLADISNIDVGDVIQLNTQIGQPLVVRTPTGTPIASGQLGIFNNHKAVQLINE